MDRVRREDPFFLMGDSRSGTTYLANLLIHHQEIGLAPESNFALRLLDHFESQAIVDRKRLDSALDTIFIERKFLDWKMDRVELAAKLEARLPLDFAEITKLVLLDYCTREFPDCRVWGLKKGGRYILDAERLLQHFPKARFVNLVRDGRAVFCSKRKALHSSTGKPLETNVIRAAECWVEFVDAFDAFRERHPENALEVSYEGMLSSLGDGLERIFRFLGVERDPSIAERARKSLDPAYVMDRSRHLHGNVSKPPLTSRIDAWRNELTDREIRAYEMVAGDALKRKGYAVGDGRADVLSSMTYRLRRSAKSLHRMIGR